MHETVQLKVTVVQSPGPREIVELEVCLPEGAQVRDALVAAGLAGCPAVLATGAGSADAPLSLWGRKTSLEAPLRDGDRLEICRPLQVDPKVARRARFQKQGARAAGLFANKRAGAKAGY
jgi:sulfur carrier protein